MAAEFIGSSGTLVGAALETVGYYYQSHILDSFLGSGGSTTVINAVGGFVYVIGALLAIVSYVFTGRQNFTIWFFIGPTIFFAMLLSRTETSGSDWQFGGEPRDRRQLEYQVQTNLGTTPYVPRVSTVFAWYNGFVSNTIRDVVKTMNGVRKNADIKHVVRYQLGGQLMASQVTDPRLREFINQTFIGECNKQLQKGREAADVYAYSENRAISFAQYQELAQQHNIKVTNGAREYLAYFLASYPWLMTAVGQVTSNPGAPPLIKTPQLEMSYLTSSNTRTNNPTGTGLSAFIDQTRTKDQAIKTQLQSYAGTGSATEAGNVRNPTEARNAADAMIGDGKTLDVPAADAWLENHVFSCHEIWMLLYAALHHEARKNVDRVVAQGEKTGLTKEDFVRELETLTATKNTATGVGPAEMKARQDRIIQAIAKRILYSEMQKGPLASLTQKYVRQSGAKKVAFVPDQDLLSSVERERVGNRPAQEKTKIMTTAFNLPYYQGVLLYVLSITFPFFSILLLLPGKHSGFLLWFMLWFWVKSWDVGFAVAMLMDDVLFSIFQVNNDALRGAVGHTLDPSMAIAMFSMHEADPTFDIGNYYMLMAIIVQSIPVISAYLVMGSLKGGAGLIAAGISRMNTPGRDFGTGTGMAHAARGAEVSYESYAARVSQQDDQMTRASRAYHGDKGGKAGIEGLTPEQRKELFLSGEGEVQSRMSGFKFKNPLSGHSELQSGGNRGMSLDDVARTGKWAAFSKGLTQSWLSSTKLTMKSGKSGSGELADMFMKAAKRDAQGGKVDSKKLGDAIKDLRSKTRSATTALDVADSTAVALRILSTAVQKSANEVYSKRLDEHGSWALLDGSISSEAREKERAYVMNDGLTLSWTEKGTGAWASSWEFSRTSWRVHKDMVEALSKSTREGLNYYYKRKDENEDTDKKLEAGELP